MSNEHLKTMYDLPHISEGGEKEERERGLREGDGTSERLQSVDGVHVLIGGCGKGTQGLSGSPLPLDG